MQGSQMNLVQLGDQYTMHSTSGNDYEDKHLPLWRSIHIHVPSEEALPQLGARRRL